MVDDDNVKSQRNNDEIGLIKSKVSQSLRFMMERGPLVHCPLRRVLRWRFVMRLNGIRSELSKARCAREGEETLSRKVATAVPKIVLDTTLDTLMLTGRALTTIEYAIGFVLLF